MNCISLDRYLNGSICVCAATALLATSPAYASQGIDGTDGADGADNSAICRNTAAIAVMPPEHAGADTAIGKDGGGFHFSGAIGLQFGLGIGDECQRTAIHYETPSLWQQDLGVLGRVDLSVEFGIAYWSSINGSYSNDELIQVTALPLLRWWFWDPFYLEGGIGVSFFNHSYFMTKDISTAFQFADEIGAGVHIANNLRLSVRYAHFSNGGISRPNPGLNVCMVSLAYDF